MLYSLTAQVSLIALIATTLFVLWAGDLWGRLSAGLHAVNWVLVSLLQKRHEPGFVFQTGDFVVDLVGAVLACAIAIKSRRLWAASLAAFQVLGVLNYFVALLDFRMSHHAFWSVAYVWEAGAILSLVAAGFAGLKARRAMVALKEHGSPDAKVGV